MKHVVRWTGRLTAVCLAAALVGCQTYGESAALGGLIGAAAGTIIGHQSDSELEGAAIGAAVGAAVGAIAKDQEVRREEQREAEYEARRPLPEPIIPPPDSGDAETLVLEDLTVLPSVVQRGNIVEVSIQYAVYNARDGVRLKETRALFKDGREIEVFASNLIYRSNGSWVSPQQFRIAHGLEPGLYEVVQTIESRNALISGRRTLRIE
jgi:hypothetical protein